MSRRRLTAPGATRAGGAPDSKRRPKRSLGQNFLVDREAGQKIVSALGAGPDDSVVELGPGRGALTRHLLGRVRHLRLVELDRDLVDDLRAELGERDDVSVVEGDMMHEPLHHAFLDPGRALVLGAIPYGITSPLVFRLLARPRPRVAVLAVQAEVAERMVAPPGNRAYGALSVGVRSVADCSLLFRLGPEAFRPRPKVRSAVVRITPLRPSLLSERDERALRRVVRGCFAWRRKQLKRTLASRPEFALGVRGAKRLLDDLGIAREARPETLSPEGFVRLARALTETAGR